MIFSCNAKDVDGNENDGAYKLLYTKDNKEIDAKFTRENFEILKNTD